MSSELTINLRRGARCVAAGSALYIQSIPRIQRDSHPFPPRVQFSHDTRLLQPPYRISKAVTLPSCYSDRVHLRSLDALLSCGLSPLSTSEKVTIETRFIA